MTQSASVSTALPVVTIFEGGSALSEFRARQLLPKLQAVDPRIEGIAARFVHLVVTDGALDAAGRERFAMADSSALDATRVYLRHGSVLDH